MVCKIAVCLCNKKLDLLFLLNWIVVYSLPTAMSSLTRNHTMDWFWTLKISYWTYQTGRSFENLCYLWIVRCHKDEDSEEYARTYYETLNQTLSTEKYQPSPPNTFCLRSESSWHRLSSSMLENKRIFSLVISKLMSAFSLRLYNLVQSKIRSTNTSPKHNLKRLRRVTLSSSVQY